MTCRSAFAVLLSALSCGFPVAALEVQLVTDLATQRGPRSESNPGQYVSIGAETVFVASSPLHGEELWITDGTAGGTRLLKDINPGQKGSHPTALTFFRGAVYFFATVPSTGTELWKTDGTSDGTVPIGDFSDSHAIASSNLVEFNEALYYWFNGREEGPAIWKTDGTEEGTMTVVTTEGYTRPASDLVATSERLFCYVRRQQHPPAKEFLLLMSTDGSTEGTVLLQEESYRESALDSSPLSMAAVDDVLFYTNPGHELWRTDGTPEGTWLVRDAGTASSEERLAELTAVGGTLFFAANERHGDDSLWMSDGTPAGTQLLRRFDDEVLVWVHSVARSLAPFRDGVLLTVTGTETHLWHSDGTVDGTRKVSELTNAPMHFFEFATLGDRAYFTVNAGNGASLWQTDGTSVGTFPILESSSFLAEPSQLRTVRDLLFFGHRREPEGLEPWISDGTAGGTRLLKDIAVDTASSNPAQLTEFDGTLYFTAGGAVWRTDGTPEGTQIVVGEAVFGGPMNKSPKMAVAGDKLFVAAEDPDRLGEIQLWTVGAALAEPEFVASLEGQLSPLRTEMAPLGSDLLVLSHWPTPTLWRSDGTAEGTARVMVLDEIRPGSVSLSVASGGLVYFIGDGNERGYGLWRTDGTEAGTRRVGLNVTIPDYSLGHWADFNGKLYFAAQGEEGVELWSTDGTEEGTAIVKDIGGPRGSYPSNLATFQGQLFFSASNSDGGGGLWKTDGSTEGTLRVSTLLARDSTAVNDTLFFITSGQGFSLAATDGSAQGTKVIRRIQTITGSPYSYHSYEPIGWNNLLVFAATGEEYGRALWVSDGGAEGTFPFDIRPGVGVSLPQEFTVVGDTLFFVAFHLTTGYELYTMRSTGNPAYREWTRAMGLSPGPAEPEFSVQRDGVTNLLKFAFNLDASRPDVRVLEPGRGTSGLPSVVSQTTGDEITLRLEYVRRTGADLDYRPIYSANGTDWAPLDGLESVVSLNPEWDRVTVTKAFERTQVPTVLGAVEVTLR